MNCSRHWTTGHLDQTEQILLFILVRVLKQHPSTTLRVRNRYGALILCQKMLRTQLLGRCYDWTMLRTALSSFTAAMEPCITVFLFP